VRRPGQAQWDPAADEEWQLDKTETGARKWVKRKHIGATDREHGRSWARRKGDGLVLSSALGVNSEADGREKNSVKKIMPGRAPLQRMKIRAKSRIEKSLVAENTGAERRTQATRRPENASRRTKAATVTPEPKKLSCSKDQSALLRMDWKSPQNWKPDLRSGRRNS
jgi:hypothetical protein